MTGIVASQSLLFSQDGDETDPWVTIFDASVDGTPASGNFTISGRNFRQRIGSDFPRACIGQMRVTYQASNDTGIVVTTAAVGKRRATNPTYNYIDTTQVPITFDGGNPGFTINAGEEKVSDPVDFTFSETDGLVFAVWTPTGTHEGAGYDVVSGEIAQLSNCAFVQTIGDTSIDTTLSASVTLGSLSLTDQVVLIKKIEVNP